MDKAVDLRHVRGQIKSSHKKTRKQITELRKQANHAIKNHVDGIYTSQPNHNVAMGNLKEIEKLAKDEISMLKKHCIKLETEPLRWFNIAMALYNFILLVLMLTNQVFLFEYTIKNIGTMYFSGPVIVRRFLVIFILGILAFIDLCNSLSRNKCGYRVMPAYVHPIRKHVFYGFTSASLAFIVLSDPLLIALYQGYASTTDVWYLGQLQPQGMLLFTAIIACVMCLDVVLGFFRSILAWRLSQYMAKDGKTQKKIDELVI